MTPKERIEYEKTIMNEIDWILSSEQYYKDGLEQGKTEGYSIGALEQNKVVAKALLENGVSIDIVSKSTGLAIETLQNL